MERDVLKILNSEKFTPTTKVFLRQEHSQYIFIFRNGKMVVCFVLLLNYSLKYDQNFVGCIQEVLGLFSTISKRSV